MMSVYGCKTKKDLKSRIGEPAAEVLQETSMFGAELKENGTVYVVGPGPYERKWYASVDVKDGRIERVK